MSEGVLVAKCGHCKASQLQKVASRNGDGRGLETHTIPFTRVECKGMESYHRLEGQTGRFKARS